MTNSNRTFRRASRLFAALLLFATAGFAIGEVLTKQGNVYNFPNADWSVSSGERALPYVNSEGYSEATISSKSVRSYGKAFLSGKSKFTASVGVQNLLKMGGGYRGKLRVTMTGIAYTGKVGAVGVGAASGWLRFIVRTTNGDIYSETFVDRTEIAALKVSQPHGVGITKSVVVPFFLKPEPPPTLIVELRLDTAAATGTVQVIPGDVISDYWNEGRGASYQSIRIEVIEAYSPGGEAIPR